MPFQRDSNPIRAEKPMSKMGSFPHPIPKKTVSFPHSTPPLQNPKSVTPNFWFCHTKPSHHLSPQSKKTHISTSPPHPITTAIQTPFKRHKSNSHEKPQKALNQPSEPFRQRFPRTDTKKAVDANLQPQESNHAHHRAHFKPQKSNQNPTNANASFCRASSHE